jgi:hypothetical protein
MHLDNNCCYGEVRLVINGDGWVSWHSQPTWAAVQDKIFSASFIYKILHNNNNNNNNNKSLLCHACDVFGFGCVLFQNQFLSQAVEGFWNLLSTFHYVNMNITFQSLAQVRKETILWYMKMLKSFNTSEDKHQPCWLVAQSNLQLDT